MTGKMELPSHRSSNRSLGYADFERIIRYSSGDVKHAVRYNSLDFEIF